eukprot:172693_1
MSILLMMRHRRCFQLIRKCNQRPHYFCKTLSTSQLFSKSVSTDSNPTSTVSKQTARASKQTPTSSKQTPSSPNQTPSASKQTPTNSYRDRDCSPAVQSAIDEMLRIDHAGEMAAVRIYEGQLATMRDRSEAATIQHMKRQEEEHVRWCKRSISEYRSRPSALMPLWEAAGFALGASTALIGKEAAMACTVAVETVIAEHYNDQLRTLSSEGFEKYEALRQQIKKHRDEEIEHHDTGLEKGAEQAPMYEALTSVIKTGCQAAIWVAKRV